MSTSSSSSSLSSSEASSSNKRTQDELGDGWEESVGKKAKTNQTDMHRTVGPSKVVHVRNLPSDVSEQELLALGAPFERVVNILLLKVKGQAFLQFHDLSAATALIQYYSSVSTNLRGRTIYFQYSSREEITTPGGAQETHNSIVLVTVLNLVYPVTIDVLYQVFSKYGSVMKIIIFHKQAGFQSLIQFSDAQSATNAKNELDGQSLYPGCCTLRIQFSSFSSLNVKYNNDKSRDFMNPNLPTQGGSNDDYGNDYMPLTPQSGGYMQESYPPKNPSILPPFSPFNNAQGPSHNQHSHPHSHPHHQHATSSSQSSSGSATLIVSNLVPDTTTVDELFTLFGVYGDVMRVKIMYAKKDQALVQFATPQQAEMALSHLNGCPLHGKPLQVNVSKHNQILLPSKGRMGSDDQGANLTKDYTNSPLHRFRVMGSKNYQHICSPSPVLHISNIAPSATEDQLKEIFGQYGTVVGFKFFPQDKAEKKMGLIQMSSIAEAIEALIALHNYPIQTYNMRVSFSKSSL